MDVNDYWGEDPQGTSTFRAIIAYFDSKLELENSIKTIKKEFFEKFYKITIQNATYTNPITINSIENFLIISFQGCSDPYGYADDPLDFSDPIFDSVLIKVCQSNPKLVIYDRGRVFSYADYVQKGIENLKNYTLEKAQSLLALAKEREMTKEVEVIQARIELLQKKEEQARTAQLEKFLKQFERISGDFSKFLRRVTSPLQSLSAFLKEISLYDYYFEEFFNYSSWKKKFDNVLQLAEQLKLADKIRVIKDHLTMLQNMNQQIEHPCLWCTMLCLSVLEDLSPKYKNT